MPGIPVENIEELWPLAAPLFDGIKSDEPFDPEEYKAQCLNGDFILWMGRNGKVAVMLEVSDYHNGKQCDIVMLVGQDLPGWIDELAEIEGWASRVGCNRMVLTGRPGWKKILTDYHIKEVIMVKSL